MQFPPFGSSWLRVTSQKDFILMWCQKRSAFFISKALMWSLILKVQFHIPVASCIDCGYKFQQARSHRLTDCKYATHDHTKPACSHSHWLFFGENSAGLKLVLIGVLFHDDPDFCTANPQTSSLHPILLWVAHCRESLAQGRQLDHVIVWSELGHLNEMCCNATRI